MNVEDKKEAMGVSTLACFILLVASGIAAGVASADEVGQLFRAWLVVMSYVMSAAFTIVLISIVVSLLGLSHRNRT